MIMWDGESPISIVQIERTCIACPSQWEGRTAHGDFIYIRYRGGWFRVDLWGDSNGDEEQTIVSLDHGDMYEGWMSDWELRQILPDWITDDIDGFGTEEDHAQYQNDAVEISKGVLDWIGRAGRPLVEDGQEVPGVIEIDPSVPIRRDYDA